MENSGTRGRPIWVHSSQVGKADLKWVCHVVPVYPNVSPGPMNGSILLSWAWGDCTANFPLGGGAIRCLLPGVYGRMHTVQRPLPSKSCFSLARSTTALSGS